jgi:hypothetical protein
MRPLGILVVLFAMGLAGCEGGPGADAPAKGLLVRKSFAGGDVVVAGPEGYCLDPATVAGTRERGFAVIASCQILSDGRVGNNVAPVIVTVTIGPREADAELPSAETMAQVAKSALLGQEEENGLVLAHLATGGDSVIDGGDPRYWRAAFLLNGRMVGLALYAPKGERMAGPEGAGLLIRVHGKIVAVSPKPEGEDAATVPTVATTSAETQSVQGTENTTKKSGRRVLSRLFGA